MISRIDKLIKESGINDKQLLKEAGLPSSALSEWRKGKAKPSLDAVTKIANHFDVSLDYLVKGASFEVENEINADLSSVFCGTNAFTRYSCYIWKALNDTIASHELLEYLMNNRISDRKNDWLVLFKECILCICESAKIICLEDELDLDEYKTAKNIFLTNIDIQNKSILFERQWSLHGAFLKALRNRIAHFDTERDKTFFEMIDKSHSHSLCEYKNAICDFSNPLFLKLIVSIYVDIYKNDPVDVESACVESIRILKDVMESLTTVMLSMLEYYFVNFTTYKEISPNKYLLTGKNEQNSAVPKIAFSPSRKKKRANALVFDESFTETEKELVSAYRKHPEMHSAVHKILGIYEGEAIMTTTFLSYDKMNEMLKHFFKMILSQELHVKNPENAFGKLDEHLKINGSVKWFHDVNDSSLNDRVDDILAYVGKTYETIYEGKSFVIESTAVAKALGIRSNVDKIGGMIISGTEAYKKLAALSLPKQQELKKAYAEYNKSIALKASAESGNTTDSSDTDIDTNKR